MTGLIFHLIPHTHWDREWYLPRAAFQARLASPTSSPQAAKGLSLPACGFRIWSARWTAGS